MYNIKRSKRFKKDFKKIQSNPSFKIEEFKNIIHCLITGQRLNIKYKDHQLKGEFSGQRECHVRPDILLVYTTDNIDNAIHLERIGSHSGLFG